MTVAERIINNSVKLLGEIIRREENDLIRQVTLTGDTLNLPQINRVGRPKVNWAILTQHGKGMEVRRSWKERKLRRCTAGLQKWRPFKPCNQCNVSKLVLNCFIFLRPVQHRPLWKTQNNKVKTNKPLDNEKLPLPY